MQQQKNIAGLKVEYFQAHLMAAKRCSAAFAYLFPSHGPRDRVSCYYRT
jgi:hypothetical protein